MSSRADVAVIGGSGFYSFLQDPEQVEVATPYGDPSAPVSVGEVGGPSGRVPARGTGRHHEYPPAPDQLPGQPVGAAVAGRPPGAGAVRGRRACATRWRRGTWWCPTSWSTGPPAVSGPSSSGARCTCRSPTPTAPACPRPSPAPEGVRRGGTMVVIDGPRFSTRAESRDYADRGWTLDQHDRCTRGRSGARAADVPGHRGAGHRHGRRRRRPGEAVTQAGRVRALRGQHRAAQGDARATWCPTYPTPPAARATTWADGLDLTYDVP